MPDDTLARTDVAELHLLDSERCKKENTQYWAFVFLRIFMQRMAGVCTVLPVLTVTEMLLLREPHRVRDKAP